MGFCAFVNAILCSSDLYKPIEDIIKDMGEDILFTSIGEDIDFGEELSKIMRIPVKHLIIDISVITDKKKLIQGLMQYRILNEKTQIIIIANNCMPGNELIHKLATQIHIYDIIAPMSSKKTIPEELMECMNSPSTYKKVLRWVIDEDSFFSQKDEAYTKEKIKLEKEIVERTVTIVKDKIIGTIVIAVSGTMNRIGTTSTALTIATFLKNQKFNVAVMEFHNSNNFFKIKNCYDDIKEKENYFILNDISFYPHFEDLNILDVIQKEYNYIVLDMGVHKQCNMEEFKRANLRLIISGVKEWELTYLEEILSENEKVYKNKYLFNFSDNKQFDFVKRNMDNLSCYMVPFIPDYFKYYKEYYDFYDATLRDVLPEIKKKNELRQLLENKVKTIFMKDDG